ncbi:hypothetical protein [Terrarubrum flagellatum]|uniref:hypothetical protein n=1 Tax=Terrirubrum flagellatum TaxID=2895980 RepID=UPI0031450C96
MTSPRLAKRTAPRAIAAAALLAIAGAASAQEACQIQDIRVCDGCTVTRRMSVQSGGGCKIEHRSDGVITNLKTIVFPKHGVFGTASLSNQAYVAAQNYVGADYFEYVITFETLGKHGSALIRNHVKVTAERPVF